MRDLQTFKFQEHQVRTVVIDGTPYWVAKDVAEVLGYTNPSKAIGDHCKGVTKRYPLQTAGGVQEMRVIGESDLYRLIAHSTLPAAEAFETWIFEEVLPAIRKTGGYVQAEPDDTPEAIMARAVLVAQNTIEQQKQIISGQQNTIQQQQAQIEDLKPKADFADAITASEGCILVRELAKILKQRGLDIGGGELFKILRETGYLIKQNSMDRNMPTQKAMDKGLFEVQEYLIPQKKGKKLLRRVTRVTPHGQRFFIHLFLYTDFYVNYWRKKAHDAKVNLGMLLYERAVNTGKLPEDSKEKECMKMYMQETGKDGKDLILRQACCIFDGLDFSFILGSIRGL